MSLDFFLVRNSTEVIIEVFLTNSAGNGVTGVPFGDINITAFARGEAGAAVAGSPVTNPDNDIWLTNGWKEVDNVTKQGLYQYSIPNAIMQAANSTLYFIFDYTGAGTVNSYAVNATLVPSEPYLGAKLSADGLDFVPIEGLTARQAIEAMASVLCGETAGAETNKTQFKAIDDNAIDRVGSTVDSETGNRTEITLTLGS